MLPEFSSTEHCRIGTCSGARRVTRDSFINSEQTSERPARASLGSADRVSTHRWVWFNHVVHEEL